MSTKLDFEFFYLNKCPETYKFEQNIKLCDKLCCEPKKHFKEIDGKKIPYPFLSEPNHSSEALTISKEFAQEHNLPVNQPIFKKKHFCKCSIFRKEKHHCFIKNPYQTFVPATGQVSSVTNRQCIKLNCSSLQSQKGIPKNYIQVRQIVLWTEDQLYRLFEPSVIRTHLRPEHLGNITLCLSHLSEFDQLFFWTNGYLRDQVSLCCDKLIKSISKRALQQKLPSEIPSALVLAQGQDPKAIDVNQVVDFVSASTNEPSEIHCGLAFAQEQDLGAIGVNQLVDFASTSSEQCQELIEIPPSDILNAGRLEPMVVNYNSESVCDLPLLDFDLSYLSNESNATCYNTSKNGPKYTLLDLTTAANAYQSQFTYIAHSSFHCYLKVNNQSKAATTVFLSNLSREAILNNEIDLIEYYMNEQASHLNSLSSQRQSVTCNKIGFELESLAAIILDEIGVGYQQINMINSINEFITSQT